ncbi:MAG: hypothetical protein ACLP50_32195 [Solirubrobacteraceae bacterium]
MIGTTAHEEQLREQRVRRLARRQGFALVKSRRRNEGAPDYGMFWIVDPFRNAIVYGGSNGTSLDDVEGWLEGYAALPRPEVL